MSFATPFATSAQLQVIAGIDLAGGKSVRSVKPEQDDVVYADALETVNSWAKSGLQALHITDLDALYGRGENRGLIKKLVKATKGADVSLAGGIDSEKTLAGAFALGVERVVLGSSALANLEWLSAMIGRFGERIAVSLDIADGHLLAGGWQRDGGSLEETIDRLERAGCARYLITEVNNAQDAAGPAVPVLTRVLELTDQPVIAAGAVTNLDDIATLRELVPAGLEGAVISHALSDGAVTLPEAIDVARS